jgi:hypothetical protein
VAHQTSSTNGGWGGAGARPVVLTTIFDGTVQYSGHLQNRGHSGNNSLTGDNQRLNDSTLDFNGNGAGGSISIHVNNHVPTNNSGAVTTLFETGNLSCSREIVGKMGFEEQQIARTPLDQTGSSRRAGRQIGYLVMTRWSRKRDVPSSTDQLVSALLGQSSANVS